MLIKEVRKTIVDSLEAYYGAEEAEVIATWLIREATGLPRIRQVLQQDEPLSAEQQNQLYAWLQRLLSREPVQYVLGKCWFADLELYIGPGALIPRPETEELAEWAITEFQRPGLRILDACTGSGCLAVALHHRLPQADVDAFDVSDEALAWAEKNKQLSSGTGAFHLFRFDLLNDHWSRADKYDLVVSNPPYVAEEESKAIQPHVLQYEPHVALFAGPDDALIFYRKLAEMGKIWLKPGGTIAMELNAMYAPAVREIFEEQDYSNVRLMQDAQGKYRFCAACWSPQTP